MLPIQLARACTIQELYEKWNSRDLFVCEPKIDGLRLIVVTGQPYSRNGKPLYNLGPVLQEIRQIPGWNHLVFDGEADGGSWEETMQLLRASKSKRSMHVHFRYRVFDVMSLEDWQTQQTASFKHRRYILEKLLSGIRWNYLTPIEQNPCRSPEQAEKWFELRCRQGFEGIVIKNLSAPYHFARDTSDRPRTWLKIPCKKTQDCQIIGYNPGQGKYEGTLGSLVVVDEHGNTTNVSGMTDQWRDEFWNHQKKYLKTIVEVEFKKLTPSGTMFAPQFKRIRKDK